MKQIYFCDAVYGGNVFIGATDREGRLPYGPASGLLGEVNHRYPKIKKLAAITRISAAPILLCFRFRAIAAPAPRSRYARKSFDVKLIRMWKAPFCSGLIEMHLYCTRLCVQKQGRQRKFTFACVYRQMPFYFYILTNPIPLFIIKAY